MKDYKKKYEEALEKAKNYHEGHILNVNPKDAMEYVFPELKENKDERIIKALIHYFSEQDGILTAINGSVRVGDIINWLEKQSKLEKKDNGIKFEPKFKVGDWVVHNETGVIHQIQNCVELTNTNTYGYDLTDGDYISTSKSDEYHLWTIQDARDGDILCIHSSESDCVFLYQNTDEIEPNKNVAVAYCCIDVYKDKIEFGIQGPDCIDVRKVKPATEEQRDLLLEKIVDAGYIWDPEKKELKKIEQESTWNEKIKGLNELETYILSLVPDGPLDDIKVDAKNIRHIINKEQKSAWSEEDEKERKHLLEMLKGWLNTFRETIYKNDCNKAISWLESLKPQPKQEWSEEDEKMFYSIIEVLEVTPSARFVPIKREIMIPWLKSLKERYSWKPTKEQIIALRWSLNRIPYSKHKEEISGLLDQIKNL